MSNRSCRGTNAAGEPCGSPVVGEDGWCPAHRPGGRERLREIGAEGGRAAHEGGSTPTGLDADALPPLAAHGDAKTWLEAIGRAVATGQLGERAAQAAIRAVSEWVKAHEGELTAVVVEELQQEVSRLQERAEPAALPAGGERA